MAPEGNVTLRDVYAAISELRQEITTQLATFEERYVTKDVFNALCLRVESLEKWVRWAITASIGLLLLVVGSVLTGHLHF